MIADALEQQGFDAVEPAPHAVGELGRPERVHDEEEVVQQHAPAQSHGAGTRTAAITRG